MTSPLKARSLRSLVCSEISTERAASVAFSAALLCDMEHIPHILGAICTTSSYRWPWRKHSKKRGASTTENRTSLSRPSRISATMSPWPSTRVRWCTWTVASLTMGQVLLQPQLRPVVVHGQLLLNLFTGKLVRFDHPTHDGMESPAFLQHLDHGIEIGIIDQPATTVASIAARSADCVATASGNRTKTDLALFISVKTFMCQRSSRTSN